MSLGQLRRFLKISFRYGTWKAAFRRFLHPARSQLSLRYAPENPAKGGVSEKAVPTVLRLKYPDKEPDIRPKFAPVCRCKLKNGTGVRPDLPVNRKAAGGNGAVSKNAKAIFSEHAAIENRPTCG